jgi:magnesium chelatase subunit H
MLEAHGRGLWQADANRLETLQNLYELTDEALEGVVIEG